MKVQNLTWGFPAWGPNKGTGSLQQNLKPNGIWLQDVHRTGGNRDSSLGGYKQNLAHTKIQGKGVVTPKETEPKPPASVESLLWRHGWEKLGLALVGKALHSKALIQLSADGWGCTPSLVVVGPEVTKSWGLWSL